MSQPSDLQLVLTLDQSTGRLNLSGNVIQNKMVAYGMLAMAQDAVRDWHTNQQNGRKLAVANIALPKEALNGRA